MDRARETLSRARAWAIEEQRVRAALVHGSTVLGRLTPLSDLDLIVIAEPGQQDAIWQDRISIATRILGTPPAVTEVLEQRPYRWQARTAELDMLDFTIDEAYMAMWSGFEGPVEFLVDRADVQSHFEHDLASQAPPAPRDVAVDADDTWGTLAKVTSLVLHGRRQAARVALNDLITENFLPLLERDAYYIGSVGDQVDGELLHRLDEAYPVSSDAADLGRATRAAARWYGELLTAWATYTRTPRPNSAIEPAVKRAIEEHLAAIG